MVFSSEGTITKSDVEEFRRSLAEENRTLTATRARSNLIKSGVLDSQGKPRWPIDNPGTVARPKRANRAKRGG